MNTYSGVTERNRGDSPARHINWGKVTISERLGTNHPDEELCGMTNEQAFANMLRYYRVPHRVFLPDPDSKYDKRFNIAVCCGYCGKKEFCLKLYPNENQAHCVHCGRHGLLLTMMDIFQHNRSRTKEIIHRFNVAFGQKRRK